MVEDVSLDKLTVLATFQSQCVTTVCVHQYELDILFLVEVAILGYKFIVILVKVFAQMLRWLMCLRFVVIELLVCLRHGDIQLGTFFLLRFKTKRSKCGSRLSDI